MGRRLRTTLPSLPSVLQPELASTPTLRAKDAEKKQQRVDHYNKRHGARVLQTCSPSMGHSEPHARGKFLLQYSARFMTVRTAWSRTMDGT